MHNELHNLRNFNYYKFEDETHMFAEYIWLDGTGTNLRSKTKVYPKPITQLEELEWWTYDGSSCQQAITEDSEIFLKPIFKCRDPFRRGHHILVLCQTYLMDRTTPALGNFRFVADKIMNDAASHDPWFGIEQEYFLFVRKGTTSQWPLMWPEGGFPYPEGRYYCSIGDFNTFGRAITEAHARCCLYAGLQLAGINAEVGPSQWEFQIGIAQGIEAADHLWMARYIINRLGEQFGVDIIIHPQPIRGDWSGSGCHTNYSTQQTRDEKGLQHIVDVHMKKLAAQHQDHILVYGEHNEQRLIGQKETPEIGQFTFAQGSRGASIRIPILTKERQKGYYEDRRPASNMDPYLVTGIIVDTTCLDSQYSEQIIQTYKEFRIIKDQQKPGATY